MSFTQNKRERIRSYMLTLIMNEDSDFISKTADAFSISLNTVYRYMRQLKDEEIIEKVDSNKYELVSKYYNFEYNLRDNTYEEDVVFRNDIYPIMIDLPENIRIIWEYSFTEMFNNIIDHSESTEAYCAINKNHLITRIILNDNGIGIFNKIKKYYGYNTLDDAILELFKGKLTTNKENHSGEGIFFTSRTLDVFIALSSNKVFSHNNYNDFLADITGNEDLKELANKKGTKIYMSMSNSSEKTLKEVFDMYADIDGGFTKTNIPLRHICESGYPVSRSQAKRLTARFDQFEEVVIDFSGIADIGQGFADELFVKYAEKHPDVTLIVENENENVKRMIYHVKTKS